jgi:hypothetical protein
MTMDDTAYEDEDEDEDGTAYYQDYFRLTSTYHEAMQLLDDNMRVGDVHPQAVCVVGGTCGLG